MRTVLLGAAALVAAVAVPASADAQRSGGAGFSTGSDGRGAVRTHRGDDRGGYDRGGDDRGEIRRDRDRRGAYYYQSYRDYQGDSLWRPDSFNDWWHERPARAYPAWMARNGKCERLWWSGGGWRC